MDILIKLFLTFLKIGTFSFGGGYAMLPFIQEAVVDENGWLTINEFLDIIGISQMTPGPVSINTATFVGFKMSGVLGGIFATLGVVIMSFILVLIVNKFLDKFKNSKQVKGALLAMRPVLIALIIKAFLDLAKESYIDLKSIIITTIIGVILLSKKGGPIIVMVVAAILGFVFYL